MTGRFSSSRALLALMIGLKTRRILSCRKGRRPNNEIEHKDILRSIWSDILPHLQGCWKDVLYEDVSGG